MPRRVRLILDSPRDPVLNMAIDEVLMESQRDFSQEPVLRFYSWDRRSYSIGYFQNVKQVVERFDCRDKKIPVVRRITGGGLVTHGEDTTFSFCAPNDEKFLPKDTKASYLKINLVITRGLKSLYPKLDFADCKTVPSGRGQGERVCFERPACYDLLLEGKKVVGASQRRKKDTVLHQSSVFLNSPREVLIAAMARGFKEEWDLDFSNKNLSVRELEIAGSRAEELRADHEWTFIPEK